ncbi:hypothetical protein [Burkholderia pyrrocinia]|uniref:hypothetical protein n=1 Tax=Burkholderia pyrrocinia TaxID=60550 RepID=UPI00158939B2|nr:hypothetical protein [Burkholderia pyrrocinia]
MENLIALDTSAWSLDDSRRYLATGAEFLRTGKIGSPSHLEVNLRLSERLLLQALLGVPTASLTLAQRRFVEAVYSLTFSVPLAAGQKAWTDTPNWRPQNRRRYEGKLEDAQLDALFLADFGLTNATWAAILHSDTLLVRHQRGQSSVGDVRRAYLALAIFGFPEPEQFFTRAPA